MSDGADQLGRVIQLIAELSRRDREGRPFAPVDQMAAAMGVSTDRLDEDVRTLTQCKEDSDHEWLGSLVVLQDGDRIAMSSRGHFLRPVRLTPDEATAILIGLALDPGGASLSAEMAELLAAGDGGADAWHPADHFAATSMGAGDLAATAARDRRCLEISYAGSNGAVTTRTVEVHRVVEFEGRGYLVAWCRRARGQRHFRTDRVLAARLLDEAIADRPQLGVSSPAELLGPSSEQRDRVRVRFSPTIARWVVERHPGAQQGADGSVVVTYEVSDISWLVRTVLQYGDEAEVIGPEAYREAVRRALAS